MERAVLINEEQLSALKKGCAIAVKTTEADLTLKIFDAIGSISYQFEKP